MVRGGGKGQGSGAARPGYDIRSWLILRNNLLMRYSKHLKNWRFIVKKLKLSFLGIKIEATEIDPRLGWICLLALAVWGAKTWIIGV